jgi:CHAT domain-containing protein
VSDFLYSGVDAVIARLWDTSEDFDRSFFTDFYTRLASTGDIAVALSGARRSHMMQNGQWRAQDWVSYQVFID